MKQAGFHQANSIIQNLGQDSQQTISQRYNELLALLHNIPSWTYSYSQPDNSDDSLSTQNANSVQQDHS